MATVLDAGLLGTFGIVFPFLFVFALIYAVLHKTGLLGKSPALNAIISVATAFLVVLSDAAVDVINIIIPWFAAMIVFFILMLLLFQMFGAKEADIFSAMKNNEAISWVLIAVGIIIILTALGTVFGQRFTEVAFDESNGTLDANSLGGAVDTSDFQQNIINTLVHPKVVGTMILFIIAIFAIALLTGSK